MATFLEVQKQVDALSMEEKAGLMSHLLNSLKDPPMGPDDEELARRVEEMDSGQVEPLTHEQFLAAVGRK